MHLRSCDPSIPLFGWPALAAVACAFFVAFCRSPESPGRSRLKPGEASHVKACEALMAQAQGNDLVVGRPASDRIVVDERLWVDLPMQSRRILASTVRCTAKPEGGAYGTVYGLRTGRRLALAHEAGVELD